MSIFHGKTANAPGIAAGAILHGLIKVLVERGDLIPADVDLIASEATDVINRPGMSEADKQALELVGNILSNGST